VIANALPPAEQSADIQRGYTAIHRLASRLGATTRSAAAVAMTVAEWDAQLTTTLGATHTERPWRTHFRKIVRAFGDGLFPCDDHPQIPRTNNDMEQALRALSTRERRITGRKHVGPQLVRIPGLVGAAELLANDPTAREQIATLPPTARRGFQTRRRQLATLRGQALAFRRDPAHFLAAVELL